MAAKTLAASQWITQFDAVATSGSTINCRWQINANQTHNIRDLRISLQPEYNAVAVYSANIDSAVSEYTLTDLNSNTRYQVCLRLITPILTDERACVDVSTAFGFLPALIGSIVGLVSAFVILACLVALSRYMQKRGVWVFRTPLKTADKRSPEEKSLLKKDGNGKDSPGGKTASAGPSRPGMQRTPPKPVVHTEHLVEEIYCGDEDDSPPANTTKPAAPAAPNGTNAANSIVNANASTIANSVANVASIDNSNANANGNSNSNSNADKTQPESKRNSLSQRNGDAAQASASGSGGGAGNDNHNGNKSENALSDGNGNGIDLKGNSSSSNGNVNGGAVVTPTANGKVIVTEALVSAECSRESAAVQLQLTETSATMVTVVRDDVHTTEDVCSKRSDSAETDKERLDNEKNESVCNERVSEVKADAATVIDAATVSASQPIENYETYATADSASSVSLSMSVSLSAVAVAAVVSPTANHVNSVTLRSTTPTLASSRKMAPNNNDYATIQMNDVPINGSLLSSDMPVSIRPPTGIYMQFVETL